MRIDERPAHPLLDGGGTGPDGVRWSLTESRAPVVHLSPARANFLGTAARAGHRLVLATDELSGLTPPLAHAWRAAGGGWVVRDSHAGLRDGFSGRALTDVPDLWQGSVRGLDDVAPAHLLVRRADALVLTVTVALQHPARAETVLGGVVEQAALLARTEAALSFGPYEPAERAWDRAELTRWFQARMPERLVQVGASTVLSSVTWAERTTAGLDEVTEATVDAGPPDQDRAALGLRVGEVLGRLAETAMPRVALVTSRVGSRDLLVPPFLQPAPRPVAVLVGPPVLRGLQADPAELADRLAGRLVGRRRLPALLVDLPPGLDEAWAGLGAVDELTGAVRALTGLAASTPLVAPTTLGPGGL